MGYEKIGPTAWGVAYQRTLSDIKYAKEIFQRLETLIGRAMEEEKKYLVEAKNSGLAPLFEARYKLTNHLLDKTGFDQILEIAAGLSPRGLEYTERDPSLQYVELDLPDMIAQKQTIVKKLAGKRDNLHLEPGNALDLDSLWKATKHFQPRPIAIITEGLLRYLNFAQKATVAKNIHALLEKFGGVWITPDMALKKMAKKQTRDQQDHNKRILDLAGINIAQNSFESLPGAQKFFEDLGFTVETHGFAEVADQLTSRGELPGPSDKSKTIVDTAVTFGMRTKP